MELVFVRKLGDGYGRNQSAPARSKPRLIKRAACMEMDEMSMTQPNQTKPRKATTERTGSKYKFSNNLYEGDGRLARDFLSPTQTETRARIKSNQSGRGIRLSRDQI